MFEDLKNWYDWKFWTKEMIREAVPDLITKEQYELITGEKYI